MLAVRYEGPRQFTVAQVPTPEPRAGEILVRVLQTGICGTDLHIHEGGFGAAFPLTPGHEVVGLVTSLGDGVEGFSVDEQVTVNPNVNCGLCDYCRRGQTLVCPNLRAFGVTWDGSFAEYLRVPERFAYSVAGLSPEVAVFTEPTSCAMHGLETLDMRPGSTALVLGAGPTGVLLAQLIRSGGASHVTVAGSSRFKLDLARRLGADDTLLMDRGDLPGSVAALQEMSGSGFDVVVEATGSAAVGEVCVPLTRNGGTVMLYGVTEPEDRIAISPFDVFRREITIKGSFAEIDSFPAAIAALRSGRVSTDGLVTHRFPLTEYAAALETLQHDRTAHKVMLDIA